MSLNRSIAVATLFSVLLLSAPAMGAEDPQACKTSNNTTITNETVEDLCGQIDTLQQNQSELEQRNSELKTENAELRDNISELETRIEELEYQAGNAERFPPWMAQDMKEMGAYDPYRNQSAFMIMQNDQILIFVGPGNGEHSLNGKSSWDTFITFREAGTRNITLSNEWYVRDGMQDEWTFRVGFQSEGAKEKFDRLVTQFNHPQTFFAWSEWNNEKRHEKGTFKTSSLMGGLLGLVGFLYIGIWVESEHDIRKDRKNRRKSENAVRHGMGLASKSKARAIKQYLLTPFRRLKDRFGGDE